MIAEEVELGVWQTDPAALAPGTYGSKFLLDDSVWHPDPANPIRVADGFSGWNIVLEI